MSRIRIPYTYTTHYTHTIRDQKNHPPIHANDRARVPNKGLYDLVRHRKAAKISIRPALPAFASYTRVRRNLKRRDVLPRLNLSTITIFFLFPQIIFPPRGRDYARFIDSLRIFPLSSTAISSPLHYKTAD